MSEHCIIFNAGYAATHGGYNGIVFLISAGVLVGPMAVIAGAQFNSIIENIFDTLVLSRKYFLMRFSSKI